jgi:hypothetical protein
VYLNSSLKKLVAYSAIGGAWIAISAGVQAATATQGTALLDRLGPVTSDLYIANADGTDEHKLLSTTMLLSRKTVSGSSLRRSVTATAKLTCIA